MHLQECHRRVDQRQQVQRYTEHGGQGLDGVGAREVFYPEEVREADFARGLEHVVKPYENRQAPRQRVYPVLGV